MPNNQPLWPISSVLFIGTVLGACSSTTDEPGPSVPSAPPSAAEAGPSKRAKRELCVDGQSVDGAYPKAEYAFGVGRTLPELTFETDATPLTLREYFEPCAPVARLLVLRVTAAWCGTCRWHAEHTKAIAALDVAPRLQLVDLLVGDEDNLPPRPDDVAKWRARVGASVKVAADPVAQLMAVSPVPSPLPLYVLVDTKRMEVVNLLNDPDPEFLELRIRQELATLDGAPAIDGAKSAKVDGFFYRNQWDLLQQMTLPGTPPADPSNAKADDPSAAAFGKKLFSDASLGPSGVACATCHDPAKAFTDGAEQSTGVRRVNRNAPSVLLASHARWQFWDGRADSLWMQALGPIESADEMGSTRLAVGHAVASKYKAEYQAIWGAMPPFTDTARFPASGKPGDASWQGMSTGDQEAATRVFVNVGKSIAAFERTLRARPNRLDAYIAGDTAALSDAEKKGMFDFFAAGCAQCHFGPRLTNDAFHVVRFPTGHADGSPDRGRIDGVVSLRTAEFNSASVWSDAPSSARLAALEGRAHPLGAFKTPPLRGVANTAPFGHGGTVPNFRELTLLYGKAGLESADSRAVGTIEPWVAKFSEHHRPPIETILEVLSGTPAP